MPEKITCYRVFMASPAGLDAERAAIREITRAFNEQSALPRGALFWVVGWESVAGGTGRPQGIINESLEVCDYFLMLLWNRWGSPPQVEGQGPYSSGTEEEFNRAYECLDSDRHQMRDIAVLFKTSSFRLQDVNAKDLAQVEAFKRNLEQGKSILYHSFDGDRPFAETVQALLNKWLFNHEKEGNPAKREAPATIVVQEEKRQPLQQDVLVRAPESAQTELPRDGTKPQDDEPGKILIRAQGLLDGGNLSDAYDAFTRLLALSGEHGQGLETRAYSGFGRVLLRRGELAQAEEQFRAALRIARSLGAKQDIADQLRFIGHVLYLRDDMMRVTSPLLEAERLYEQTGPR